MADLRAEALAGQVRGVAGMTLTVIDGELPADHLRDHNLVFERYAMSARRNSPATWTRRPAGPAVWIQRQESWFR